MVELVPQVANGKENRQTFKATDEMTTGNVIIISELWLTYSSLSRGSEHTYFDNNMTLIDSLQVMSHGENVAVAVVPSATADQARRWDAGNNDDDDSVRFPPEDSCFSDLDVFIWLFH